MANHVVCRIAATDHTAGVWDVWSTEANAAAIDTSGTLTGEKWGFKKFDEVWTYTGCSAVGTRAERLAATAKNFHICMADQSLTDGVHAVNLSDAEFSIVLASEDAD